MATERDPGCSCWRCPSCRDDRLMERFCPCFEAGVKLSLEVTVCETMELLPSSPFVPAAAGGSHGREPRRGAGRP